MNILGIVIYLGSAYLAAKGKKILPFTIICLIACVIVGMLTWISTVSLLSITDETIVSVACGFKKLKYVRYVSLIGSLCWLIYDSVYFSIGGIITEVFAILSIIIETVRFHKEENRNVTKSEVGKIAEE